MGREVEKFAEQLDRLNPRNHEERSAERYSSALALVDEYRALAKAAVGRLRSKHAPRRQKQVHDRWRQRIEGFKGDGATEPSDDALVPFDDGEVSLRRSQSGTASQTTLDDLRHWEQEEQTWSLLRQLVELHHPEPQVDRVKEKRAKLAAVGDVDRFSSEDKIWDRFIIEDDVARERQVVMAWLKDNAESSGKDIDILVEQLEGGADRGTGLWAHGWLHTKEAIKAQKRLRSWPQALDPTSPGLAASLLNADRTEGLVTQLDPDAATRQRHVLEKPDQYFERATWLACWEMLRRGRPWSEIREWCKDRVEGWRAVSLRGAIAAWDGQIDGAEPESRRNETADETTAQVTGNRSRGLWRSMCHALAVSGGIDDYERAVYGLLAGDLASVERVCHSWDDIIFAHYNSLLLGQFEGYLRSRHPERLPSGLDRKLAGFDAVQFHGDPATVSRRIVDGLRANKLTTAEARQPMKTLQGALIGRTLADFAYQQGLVLSRAANAERRSTIIPAMTEPIDETSGTAYLALQDYDGLRVLVHVLLTLQDLGLDFGEGNREIAVENIVVAYIDFLRLSGKLLMIPLYASRLSPERQILILGRVLLDETAASRRRELLRLMYGLGIDVPQVLNMQLMFLLDDVELEGLQVKDITTGILQEMRQSQKPGRQIRRNFIGSDIDDIDARLIRSFEWFLLVDGHWEMTFKAGELLYRRFFALGHLAAARVLLERVPASLISRTKSGVYLGKAVDVSVPVDESEGEEDVTQATPRATRSGRQQAEHLARRRAEAERARMKTQALARQAQTFSQLEALARALVAMEKWKATADKLHG